MIMNLAATNERMNRRARGLGRNFLSARDFSGPYECRRSGLSDLLSISALDQKRGKFGIVVRSLAAQTNLATKSTRLVNRLGDQGTDDFIPFIENMRADLGFAVDAQRELRQVVGGDREAMHSQSLAESRGRARPGRRDCQVVVLWSGPRAGHLRG